METSELSLQDYFTVLRRRWLLITLVTVAGCAAAFAWSNSQTRTYSARTDVLVDFDLSAQITDPANQTRSVTDRARRLENELRFARSSEVTDRAQAELGEKAKATIAAESTADLITFTSLDSDPDRAALEANTYAEAYTKLRATKNAAKFAEAMATVDGVLDDLRSQLQALPNKTDADTQANRLSLQQQIQTYEARRTSYSLLIDANQDNSASIINRAEAPTSPVAPKPLRTAVLALVLALMASTGGAFLLEFLDDRLRTKDDLDGIAGGAASLALIPRSAESNAGTPASLSDSSPVAEAFRNLRTSVRFVALRQPLRSLQITSANPAEGKTTVACHLAVSLAHSGASVILIDGDLRSPRLHERFSLGANDAGLAGVMLGQLPIESAVRAIDGCPNLWVLPSGPAPGNPGDFLWPADAPTGVLTLPALIEQLVHAGYTVIVDSPPVLPVADARTLSRCVDGTIFVAAARSTHARAASRALELLHQADARIVGTVLNRVTQEAGTYGYGYGANAPQQKGVLRRFRRNAAGSSQVAARRLEPAASAPVGTPGVAFTMARPTPSEPEIHARPQARPAMTDGDAAVGTASEVNGTVKLSVIRATEPTNGHATRHATRTTDASTPPRTPRAVPPQIPVPASTEQDELTNRLRHHLGLEAEPTGS